MKATLLKVLIAAVTLASCASAPTQYLTLMPPPGGAVASISAQVPVVTVTVPSQVDQSELVVRQSDGSLALLQSVRWIAPLADEIRTALALSLSERWAALPAMRINVDVQRFDSVPGQYACIESAWTLTAPGSPAQKFSGRSAIKESVGRSYAALAAGHRQALDEIAAQILAQAHAIGTPAP
jgi:uncharacterized lipoprotein YmbA